MKIIRFNEANMNQFKNDGSQVAWIVVFLHKSDDSEIFAFSEEKSADNFIINHINEEDDHSFITLKEAMDWWDDNFTEGIEYKQISISTDKIEIDPEVLKRAHTKRFDL